MILPKRLIMIAVVAIAAIIAIAVVVSAFTGIVNNPCPPGQCGQNNPPVYFSVTFMGYIVNPTWSVLYATVQNNGASSQPCGSACGQSSGVVIAPSGAPGLSFKSPKLDFWTNNYKLTGSYTVTYPSGATYAYTFTEIDGAVAGSAQGAWSQTVYNQGPHGLYTVSLTLNYLQTGCNNGCSVSGQIQASGSGTI